MATVARSFRRAALFCSRQATPWQAPAACSCSVTQPTQRRKFSVTPVAFNQNGEEDAQASSTAADGAAKDAESDGSGSAPANKNEVSASAREFQSIRHHVKSIDREFTMGYITPLKKSPDIDPYYFPCRTFNDDGMPSMAIDELEVHREIREYARIAAWDMPSLSSMSSHSPLSTTKHPLPLSHPSHLFFTANQSSSQALQNPSSHHRPPSHSVSATPPTSANPILLKRKSSWKFAPKISPHPT